MVKKRFWVDPYLARNETVISSLQGNEITLKESTFFAFSGGQESDSGTIAGLPVVSARKEGFEIFYTLPSTAGFSVGQSVLVEIDWTRRYRLMKLHFAAELVLELFYQKLDGVTKVGAHIAANKARIDFGWPQSIAPLLPQFAQAANDIIASDLEIKTGFDDEANERRYWEIDGFSKVPCGGTHVRRTKEIGPIRLKRDNIGKGKERVEIYLAQ